MANEIPMTEQLIINHYKGYTTDELELERARLQEYIKQAQLRESVIGKMLTADKEALSHIDEVIGKSADANTEMKEMMQPEPQPEKTDENGMQY